MFFGQQTQSYDYSNVATVRTDMGWAPGRANLDASALIVKGSPSDINSLRAVDSDPFQSFVNKQHLNLADGSVQHCGEDRTGAGPNWMPDESIITHLGRLRADATGVLYILNIEDGFRKGVEFDEIKDVWSGVIDVNSNRQLNRTDVDRKFKGLRSACVGGVFRTANGWSYVDLTFGSTLEAQFLLRGFGLNV